MNGRYSRPTPTPPLSSITLTRCFIWGGTCVADESSRRPATHQPTWTESEDPARGNTRKWVPGETKSNKNSTTMPQCLGKCTSKSKITSKWLVNAGKIYKLYVFSKEGELHCWCATTLGGNPLLQADKGHVWKRSPFPFPCFPFPFATFWASSNRCWGVLINATWQVHKKEAHFIKETQAAERRHRIEISRLAESWQLVYKGFLKHKICILKGANV